MQHYNKKKQSAGKKLPWEAKDLYSPSWEIFNTHRRLGSAEFKWILEISKTKNIARKGLFSGIFSFLEGALPLTTFFSYIWTGIGQFHIIDQFESSSSPDSGHGCPCQNFCLIFFSRKINFSNCSSQHVKGSVQKPQIFNGIFLKGKGGYPHHGNRLAIKLTEKVSGKGWYPPPITESFRDSGFWTLP